MDNPQQRMWQLCWLAGVIDSDGSIALLNVPHGRSGTRTYRPRVNIVNTNRLLIERAAEILDHFGVGRHVSTRRGEKIGWRIRGQINVDGFKRAIKLLRLIEPHLVAKREQANLIISLWEYRKEHSQRAPYGENEVAMVERVKYLNQTGVTFCSEANMPDPAQAGEDRVRTASRGVEAAL